MKTIIYAGIGLFSVAATYGIADYYAEEKKGTLKTMYHEETVVPGPEEKAQEATTSRIEATTATVTSEPKKATTKKAFKKRRPEIKFENFSRGKIVRDPAIRRKDSTELKHISEEAPLETKVTEEE